MPGLSCADQLQRAVERGEYAEAARLLEAVQQLAAHFQAFGSVPKVWQPSEQAFQCGDGALEEQILR